MLSELNMDNLKNNWGRKADSMYCHCEVQFYDQLSDWSCYLYAMNPDDDDEIACLITMNGQFETRIWSLQALSATFNKDGENPVLNQTFKRVQLLYLISKIGSPGSTRKMITQKELSDDLCTESYVPPESFALITLEPECCDHVTKVKSISCCDQVEDKPISTKMLSLINKAKQLNIYMDNQQIKELREKLNISQERFAYLLGTTCVTVCRWESGKSVPSRLYFQELDELKRNHELYIHRRKRRD